MTCVAPVRFTRYIKWISTSFVTSSELFCSLQGQVKGKECNHFYSWIARKRLKLRSFLKHIHPCIQQSLEITFLCSGNLCFLEDFLQLYVAGLEFYFILYVYTMTEIMERKTTAVCGCPDMNAWTNKDASIPCSCKLADQRLIWTLQFLCTQGGLECIGMLRGDSKCQSLTSPLRWNAPWCNSLLNTASQGALFGGGLCSNVKANFQAIALDDYYCQ